MPDFDPHHPWHPGAAPPRPVPSHSDFVRLEDRIGSRIDKLQEHTIDRLDRLGETMQQLVALQSEMGHQDQRIEAVERREADRRAEDKARDSRISDVSSRLDRVISYGVGAWAVVGVAWTIWRSVDK